MTDTEKLNRLHHEYGEHLYFLKAPSMIDGFKIAADRIKESYTEREVAALVLEALSMGMDIRQKQLQGYGGGKSGKEILNEWFDIIKDRKKAGLMIP